MTIRPNFTLIDIERQLSLPFGSLEYSGDSVIDRRTGELIGEINHHGDFIDISQSLSPTVDADQLELNLTTEQIQERELAEAQLNLANHPSIPFVHKYSNGYDRHEAPEIISFAARQEFKRRYGRDFRSYMGDKEALAQLEQELTADRQMPELDLAEDDFVFQASGSAPELPFPAARISTVSGTIILNASAVNRLRNQYQGQPPTYVGLAIHPTQLLVRLTFAHSAQYGFHKLGMATEYNRGWTIHCKSVIGQLTYRAMQHYDLHSDPYGKSSIEQAADWVFGRRRLAKLANSNSWVLDLTSPIV